MGDSGEGLIDAEARIQERQEEMERARVHRQPKTVRDPDKHNRAATVASKRRHEPQGPIGNTRDPHESATHGMGDHQLSSMKTFGQVGTTHPW